MKKKYVFTGDLNSINLELVHKSHNFIKNKVKYILLGNINDASHYLKKLKSKIRINEIYNPLNFENYNKDSLNFYNIENISNKNYKNLINQINIANHLSNTSRFDLVTLPINKSILKRKIKFIGMTEYLGKINNKKTIMLMKGENFSIIPITTHINLKDVSNFVSKVHLQKFLNEILKQLQKDIYNLDFKSIKFLCYNPHCSESNTIGSEDKIIKDLISKFKKISGPFSADSAFKNIKKNHILFISMYHDQALIPFKILNQKGINLTMGLDYRRLSPAHGTADNLKYKNMADTSSYIACMNF